MSGDDILNLRNADSLYIDLGKGSDDFNLWTSLSKISEKFDVQVNGGEGSDYFEIYFEGTLIADGDQFTSIFEMSDPKPFALSLDGGAGNDTLNFDYVNKRMHGVYRSYRRNGGRTFACR